MCDRRGRDGQVVNNLYSCHLKLSLDYVFMSPEIVLGLCSLKSHLENPAYRCVFKFKDSIRFVASAAKIPPLGLRILPQL